MGSEDVGYNGKALRNPLTTPISLGLERWFHTYKHLLLFHIRWLTPSPKDHTHTNNKNYLWKGSVHAHMCVQLCAQV